MNKRMISVLLIVMLLFTLCSPVYAEAAATYTVTIPSSETGHTYEAYQIFTGDLNGKTLSNIQWGDGISKSGRTALEAKYGVEGAVKVAEKITDVDDFAKIAGANLTTVMKTSTATSGGYEITGLPAGYYLIKDKDNSVPQGSAYTSYIVEVVEDSNIAPKSSVPTVEKKVQENSNSEWQDAADYSIGDSVPFKLTATLGSKNLDKYDTYKVVFHDTLSQGLTYNKDVKVKVGETLLTEEQFTVNESNGELTITINDVKVLGATDNTVITAEYTAKLNDKAVIGGTGNPNTVYLEYSNNPNSTTTGKTAEDKVVVFTYELDIDKVNKENEALEGAGFTLYQYSGSDWVKVGDEITGVTKFTWKGLDAGKYKLEETTTPSGYNTADPIEFTITATYDTNNADPELLTLTVTPTDKLSAYKATGVIKGQVVNYSGSVLPETGGIGTTIFYVLGGLLVVGAAVMLIARKRVNQ